MWGKSRFQYEIARGSTWSCIRFNVRYDNVRPHKTVLFEDYLQNERIVRIEWWRVRPISIPFSNITRVSAKKPCYCNVFFCLIHSKKISGLIKRTEFKKIHSIQSTWEQTLVTPLPFQIFRIPYTMYKCVYKFPFSSLSPRVANWTRGRMTILHWLTTSSKAWVQSVYFVIRCGYVYFVFRYIPC